MRFEVCAFLTVLVLVTWPRIELGREVQARTSVSLLSSPGAPIPGSRESDPADRDLVRAPANADSHEVDVTDQNEELNADTGHEFDLVHRPSVGVVGNGSGSRAASAALFYIARPQIDTMPLLPDVPGRAVAMGSDTLPSVDRKPPENAFVRRLISQTSGITTSNPVADVGALENVTLLRSEARSGDSLRARISGNGLALRTGPAKRYPSVAALARGTTIRVTGARQGGYLPVEVASTGAAGWVFHSYVENVN